MLLNHLDHKVVEIKSDDLTALFEVTVLDKDKVYYKFKWAVEKYIKDGPHKDCWLTTMGLRGRGRLRARLMATARCRVSGAPLIGGRRRACLV